MHLTARHHRHRRRRVRDIEVIAFSATLPEPVSTLRPIAVCLIIGAAIAAAYQPIGPNSLVWDDTHTIVQTDRYSQLDGDSLRWIFTTTLGGHYQPLTWLSFAADYRLWGGLSPAGIHLTNVFLHFLKACGLFFICRGLLNRLSSEPSRATTAALAAALWWAVHPLRVESVAWATERRDVLSGVFLVGAVLGYLRCARPASARSGLWLVLALISFACSLLSKAAGITLPFVLVLLDFFPLRRASLPLLAPRNAKVLTEKVLFLAPAAAIALAALWAQSSAGALRGFGEHPISLRLVQACYGIVFYLRKLVWPSNLLPLYEQDPNATPWDPAYLLALLLVAGVTGLLFWKRRTMPGLTATWLAYLLLLLPVLGLAQSGPQVVADRYTYFASMPWAVALSWCVAGVLGKRRRPAWLPTGCAIACVAMLVLFIRLSRNQVCIWRNEYTLWSTVVARAPETGMAHANLAVELNRRGEYAEATEHAEHALARLPGNRAAHLALGSAALQLGDLPLAAQHLTIAVKIADDIGKPDTAGMARLAAAKAGLGQRTSALQLYQRLISLEPHEAEWEFQYGSFLASIEDFPAARAHLLRAVQLRSSEPAFYLRLAVVQARLGERSTAIDTLAKGLAADPRSIDLQSELAWMLATTPDDGLRDGAKALVLAQSAIEASRGTSRRAKEALAAAHAERGDFERAIEIVQAELAGEGGQSPTRKARLEAALLQYRVHHPLRE